MLVVLCMRLMALSSGRCRMHICMQGNERLIMALFNLRLSSMLTTSPVKDTSVSCA